MQPQDRAESVTDHSLAAIYGVGELIVDTGRVTVMRGDRELALPKLSFDLLVALIEAAPSVVSQEQLMDRVWAGLVVGPETVSQRVKLLRDSLDDDPKSPRYIAGVRGRGYRLLPEVRRLAPAGAATLSTAASPDVRTAFPWRAALLAFAMLAAAGIWLLIKAGRDTAVPLQPVSTEALPARSVAVLAFEDRGGGKGASVLAQGIPETVLHQLSRVPRLTVIARGSSFAFQDADADLRLIGRQLKVRYLLEGSVQTAGNRLRVTSSLVDAETGANVWSMQFDRKPEDIFAVQDEIAVEVVRAMQVTFDAGTDAAVKLQHGATRNYEAYVAFMRGRALLANMRVADLPAAIESLSGAIRHDSNFATAFVLLARARVALAEQAPLAERDANFRATVENALELLDEAIALDPASGEAYVERGHLKMFYDLAAADADLRRGLELAPNYARGYEGLAEVMFQTVARRRDALEMIEKARRLDPLEPRFDVIKATYLHYGPGDGKQAKAIIRGVLERDPLYVPALVRQGNLLWHYDGAHAESIQLLEQAVAQDPGNEAGWRQLASDYLEVDDPEAAAAAFNHVQESPLLGQLHLQLYRREWRAAGETAYAIIDAGPTNAYDEWELAFAIRMHARETRDYARAIRVLEDWSVVEWEEDGPVLGGQLDMGFAVAGLADVLALSGKGDRARSLTQALLADADLKQTRFGRGKIWLDDGRALAYALLNRPEEAMQALRTQAEAGVLRYEWRSRLVDDPAFDLLRKRPDFRRLIAEAQANAKNEREQLDRMRADGLVPTR